MPIINDINPWLPDSQQITPAKEGGHGFIHKPGEYNNVIWQHRSRLPDSFETSLIATLEEIFAQGTEALSDVIQALNTRRVFNRDGQPWNEANFRHFLQVHAF